MILLPCTAIVITNCTDKRFEEACASARHFAELLIIANTTKIDARTIPHPNVVVHEIGTDPITDFSEVRTQALQKASYKWVFFLDSDEVIQPFAAAKIMPLLTQTAIHGFWCRRSDIFLGKQLQYGEAGNQKVLRLLHTKYASFEGAIHEVAVVRGKQAAAPLTLLHYSHSSVSAFLADVTAYATTIGSSKPYRPLQTLFELLVFPIAKGLYSYFFQLGFLDGYRGLIYTYIMSIHSLAVRATTYETHRNR